MFLQTRLRKSSRLKFLATRNSAEEFISSGGLLSKCWHNVPMFRGTGCLCCRTERITAGGIIAALHLRCRSLYDEKSGDKRFSLYELRTAVSLLRFKPDSSTVYVRSFKSEVNLSNTQGCRKASVGPSRSIFLGSSLWFVLRKGTARHCL